MSLGINNAQELPSEGHSNQRIPDFMSLMLASQYQDEWVEENLTGRFEINSVLFDIGLCLVAVPFERDAMKPNSYVHIQI